MRKHHALIAAAFCSATLVAASTAKADEFGFSTYGLGAAAFGAGVTPPPGTYITYANAYYEGNIGGPITIGGVLINAGLKVNYYSSSVNGLYVPERKILGGQPGISVTVPVGYIDLNAQLTGPLGNTVRQQTDGWGFGDVTTRAQLGWTPRTDFSHLAWIQAVAPTGRYDVGFEPNIGLNRPGIDVGWAFTWTEKMSKLQFNGAFGVTYNFNNEDTDYKSGTDFHFEWAIGREICKGLMIGVVGYDYRQISDDTGAGAILGPFDGDVDAIGAGLEYTTIVGKTPLILNARSYKEYDADHRFIGSMTILSGTVRF